MSAMTPVSKDHPLMRAWEAYKQTEDYANTRRWAAHEAHVEGSLWAAFERGWRAADQGRVRQAFEAGVCACTLPDAHGVTGWHFDLKNAGLGQPELIPEAFAAYLAQADRSPLATPVLKNEGAE